MNKQEQLIKLVFEGNNNRAIATILGLSEKTIENKLKEIYRKFNVRNRVELRLKYE